MKVIMKDGSFVEMKYEEDICKKALNHTAAHILAQAVNRLYPNVKCAIGPAIDDGFYYDFEFDFNFSSECFEAIEHEMKNIVKENLPLKREILSKEEALQLMKNKEQDYKIELINDIDDGEELSFFRQGEYIELCKGEHVAYTSSVKAFKLMNVAGAYWRGSEHNKMLTRIYGVAFPNKSMLNEYLLKLEEIKRRDHRKIGKELELFAFMEEGPGFPFFLPKGVVLKNILVDYWRSIHQKEGYVEISTPIMLNRELWETSGHWEHYRENMYSCVIDDNDFAIKPMNCPGGMLVYKSKPRSYKELPLRIGELGLVHRHEQSGALHGLMRVRSFTQDDAHIFMMEEQICDEIKGVIRLIDEVYKRFGFKYHIELSTRPEKSIGSDRDWEIATKGLKGALDSVNINYSINEGDGAFYGPKIDFHLEDSIGRTWQCGTIQLDFQLPLRFNAEYIGKDGKKHRPIMIHRVVFGSIERFIGILIEHYAGVIPLWLAPLQVKILPISDKYMDYARKVENILKAKNYRCELDDRVEKIGYKIREAEMQHIPYMIIIGENEVNAGEVSVRQLGVGSVGKMSIEKMMDLLDESL